MIACADVIIGQLVGTGLPAFLAVMLLGAIPGVAIGIAIGIALDRWSDE